MDRFKEKLRINDFWKFFEINVVVARESEDVEWKTILMSVIPLLDGTEGQNTLFEDSSIMIIKDVRSSNLFDDFLLELFTRERMTVGNVESSSKLVKSDPFIKYTDRLNSRSLVGIEFPGEILYVIGADPASIDLGKIKTFVENNLLIHDPPYQNIEDVISDLLHITRNRSALDTQFPVFGFRPSLMIFSPHYIRFENVRIVNDKLEIWTVLREEIDPTDIKISIIGKGLGKQNLP